MRKKQNPVVNRDDGLPKLPGLELKPIETVLPIIKPPSKTLQRVINTSTDIRTNPPERLEFLHAVLCQVGMPRRRVDGRSFERRSGGAVMCLEAGSLFNGHDLVKQPLPYGTRPRLVMVHLSSEAIRTKSRTIEVGESVRSFLLALGIDTSGGAKGGYTMFKKQMQALAACRMTIGMNLTGRNVTINTQPISRFEAWTQNDNAQQSMWPGVMELSQDFFETLNDHAVPLDHRALAAIKHSSLALDIYTWLAHRLCRINKLEGVRVSWINLQEQFGQEYLNIKDFKREFGEALHQVLGVYPDAKIESVTGGLLLKPSSSSVRKIQLLMPNEITKFVDKQED